MFGQGKRFGVVAQVMLRIKLALLDRQRHMHQRYQQCAWKISSIELLTVDRNDKLEIGVPYFAGNSLSFWF